MSINKLLNRHIKQPEMERRNCKFCGDFLQGKKEFCSDFCCEAYDVENSPLIEVATANSEGVKVGFVGGAKRKPLKFS